MYAQSIYLQNEDGSHCRRICQAEAARMEKRREIYRVTKRKPRDPKAKVIYRLFPVAKP
jgi:hypothetical protein